MSDLIAKASAVARPLLGKALSKGQEEAIKALKKHIEQGLKTGDDFGVYRNAVEIADLASSAIVSGQIMDPEQRQKIYELFAEVCKKRDSMASPIIGLLPPDNPQRTMGEECDKFVKTFSQKTSEYKKHMIEEKVQREIETERQQRSLEKIKEKERKLHKILSEVVRDTKDFEYKNRHIKLIRDSLTVDGIDYFEKFRVRYELPKEKLSSDDLRMIIVGAIANRDEKLEKSRFFLKLVLAINQQQLLSYKEHSAIIRELENKPPTELVPIIINYIRDLLPGEWKRLITQRFKVNNNFNADLKTATYVANAEKWQNKSDSVEQQAASHEYLFHRLAYCDLQEGAIVPVIEQDGSSADYTAKKLVNAEGYESFVLVPRDTSKANLDIKVLFRGTHDLGSAIIDAEQYGAGYKRSRLHETELMTKLNSIVGGLKADAAKSGNTQAKICLVAGGHSLGGALTQNFLNYMAQAKFQKEFQKHEKDPGFKEKLLRKIEKQIDYEIKVGYIEDDTPEAKKDLAIKRVDYLLKTAKKQQDKREGKRKGEDVPKLEDHHLQGISSIQCSTINAAGVSYKVRDNFTSALACIKGVFKDPTEFAVNNILVGGDIVQRTGQANVSNAINPKHMCVDTIKVDMGLEGRAKQQAALCAAYRVVTALTQNCLLMLLPLIPDVPGFFDILDSISRAHCDLHFEDSTKPKYKCMSNINKENQRQQVKELSTKIFISKSRHFQKAKKHLSKFLGTIYSYYDKADKTAHDTLTKGGEMLPWLKKFAESDVGMVATNEIKKHYKNYQNKGAR